MTIGKSCAYTICKNEIRHIENWIHYTANFDYRVLLDTGSTDGTYELLKQYPNVIIEQKIFTPWNFSTARNYNLEMIPDDVDVALSPDMDEWFSVNILEVIDQVDIEHPNWDCISVPRLDIYSPEVYIGPPRFIGSNKIHKLKHGNQYRYRWQSPIYEHLAFQPHGVSEEEIATDRGFLIHNQHYSKTRSPLYVSMLIEQYEKEPTDTWCLWYLVNHYFKERDLDNFIITATDFLIYEPNKLCDRYREVKQALVSMFESGQLNEQQMDLIRQVI